MTPHLTTLDRLSSATRDLSRFSRSAAGLGSVLGGALCLASSCAHALLPLTPATRLLLATFPFLWILAKELLRRRFYQRLGRIDQPLSRRARLAHLAITLYTIAFSLLVLAAVLPRTRTPATAGYALIILLMPWITWRYLRTTNEYIVGTFLLCQAAVGLAGSHYHTPGLLLTPIVCSLLMILTGLLEHRRFLAAQQTLRDLQSQLTTDPLGQPA